MLQGMRDKVGANIGKTGSKIIVIFAIFVIVVFYISEGLRGSGVEFQIFIESMKFKYIFLFLFLFFSFCFISISKINPFGNRGFYPESKWFFISFFTLLFISIYFQVINGFLMRGAIEFLTLVAPFLFVSFCAVLIPEKMKNVLEYSFSIIVIIFLLKIARAIPSLSLQDFSFANSSSPLEDNFMGPLAILFLLYFMAKSNKKKSLLCLILILISFKRMILVKGLLFYVFFRNGSSKKVPQSIYYLTIAGFCVLPILLYVFYKYGLFVTEIEMFFDENINTLTMDRYRRTAFVIQDMKHYFMHGLGSTTEFLTNHYADRAEEDTTFLHNDILKLYLECTIVGSTVFIICLFSMIKKNKNLIGFLLLFHVFSEMIFTPMIGQGNVLQWIFIYMIIFLINRRLLLFNKTNITNLKPKLYENPTIQ
jgi:hypothetical protein